MTESSEPHLGDNRHEAFYNLSHRGFHLGRTGAIVAPRPGMDGGGERCGDSDVGQRRGVRDRGDLGDDAVARTSQMNGAHVGWTRRAGLRPGLRIAVTAQWLILSLGTGPVLAQPAVV